MPTVAIREYPGADHESVDRTLEPNDQKIPHLLQMGDSLTLTAGFFCPHFRRQTPNIDETFGRFVIELILGAVSS
jgi:hypothetical protein